MFKDKIKKKNSTLNCVPKGNQSCIEHDDLPRMPRSVALADGSLLLPSFFFI